MKRGFTLVEMVLVLVIVSILAQLTNVAMKSRREAAIVDVLTEYIQIFVGAMRMYYYNHQGNFPEDFTNGANLKQDVPSLKPYLPRNFSNFKIIENYEVKAYVKEQKDENSGKEETNSDKLVGYGIVITGINDTNILEKLKDQLLLEVNMKDASIKESREELMNLIQIDGNIFTFYLKTEEKSYL